MKKPEKKDAVVVFPEVPIKESQFTWLIYYANKSDGTPVFRTVDNSIYAIKRLRAISNIFNADGSYNGANKRAERYAICLAAEGKKEEALKLFLAIVGDSENILLVEEDGDDDGLEVPPVANMPEKLGYEGAFVYASICLDDAKKRKRALAVFREIAEKAPIRCEPWRLREILTDSLKVLLEHGIKEIGKIDVEKRLEAAIESQY